MVFRAGFIQICEVHTYQPHPILLLYYYYIGQPLKVENFLNSLGLFKLVHLLLDSVRMLFR